MAPTRPRLHLSRNVQRAALMAVVVIAALMPSAAAFASHPEVSLPGSNFEIDTDANLRVDDPAPSLDWANVAETRKQDTASGPTDESFGQGSKEDTAVPSVVDGSIPPNKSDLKFFGVYQEGTTSNGFLNLFWSRVQDPSGTTNMDFEFNQSATLSGNGVTPVRTAGDLLVIYDLAQGGTHPVLSLRTWTGSAWGPATDLTSSGTATGSINTSPISAGDSDGLGAQSARTFGEAQLSLAAIFPNSNVCLSFGSAYLKSRSSDSFTAALKDFVPPVPVNISNCGSVRVHKVDDLGSPLAGAVFTLYVDNAPIGGVRGPEDTITAQTCTTAPDGFCTISGVLAGAYWVVETTVPPGHDGAADQQVTVVADVTITLSDFVNPRHRGAILATKTRKHAADGSGDHPHAGVDFTVNGVTRTTDGNGQACFDNLAFGQYTVHETTPAGYVGEGDQTVTVDNKASCTDNPYVGETVAFHNTPLSTITITFFSQVVGGTAVTQISCTGLTDSNPDPASATFADLVPGTYNCTVVIDP